MGGGDTERKREGGRETETDKELERETDRQTDRQRAYNRKELDPAALGSNALFLMN